MLRLGYFVALLAPAAALSGETVVGMASTALRLSRRVLQDLPSIPGMDMSGMPSIPGMDTSALLSQMDANSILRVQQAMYCNNDQTKSVLKQLIDSTMTEEGSDPAFAASLPTAQLVECLCQSSWDVSDRSFTDFLGIAGQGVIQGMEPADWPRLVDTLEVMLPLMGSASNLCSPKCKAAIQAYLSALTKSSNTLYTQAGLPQEVAAIAGMTDADAASEVECLCAWDLTSMLRDLKPLLTRARELMSQPAQQAGEQPGTGLLGQGGHGGQGGQAAAGRASLPPAVALSVTHRYRGRVIETVLVKPLAGFDARLHPAPLPGVPAGPL